MNKLQANIQHWQKKTFPNSDSAAKYNHLIKETLELKEALINKDHKNIREELADCMILLIGIAGCNNIDITEAASEKMEINKNRKWGIPDKNGVVLHLKERK